MFKLLAVVVLVVIVLLGAAAVGIGYDPQVEGETKCYSFTNIEARPEHKVYAIPLAILGVFVALLCLGSADKIDQTLE